MADPVVGEAMSRVFVLEIGVAIRNGFDGQRQSSAAGSR
jgi:hypothetical protein